MSFAVWSTRIAGGLLALHLLSLAANYVYFHDRLDKYRPAGAVAQRAWDNFVRNAVKASSKIGLLCATGPGLLVLLPCTARD